MSKIDVSAIDGYAEMSAEEKLAALEAYEFEDHTKDAKKYKDAVSKASSEAAEYKRKLKEIQDKSSEGQSETEKQLADMQSKLEAMQHEKTVSDYTAQFIAQGYDKELASDTADAMAKGDMARVFANNAKFLESHDKAIKADLAQHSIQPPTGNKQPDGTGMTKKKLKAMSALQRAKFAAAYPEDYAKLYKE